MYKLANNANIDSRDFRGLGSILTGVRFCYRNILFSRSKASDANIGIIANFVYLWENSIWKSTEIHTHRENCVCLCIFRGLTNISGGSRWILNTNILELFGKMFAETAWKHNITQLPSASTKVHTVPEMKLSKYAAEESCLKVQCM